MMKEVIDIESLSTAQLSVRCAVNRLLRGVMPQGRVHVGTCIEHKEHELQLKRVSGSVKRVSGRCSCAVRSIVIALSF